MKAAVGARVLMTVSRVLITGGMVNALTSVTSLVASISTQPPSTVFPAAQNVALVSDW